MAIVQSAGRILTDESYRNWYPTTLRSVRLYDNFVFDYAALYRLQPNVRVCVDFLARNIAQLGLHVFRRVDDSDRERLRDHPLAQLIKQPLPAEFKVTRYRLIESLVADLGIYFNAFWLKLRIDDRPLRLLRLPPELVEVHGGLVPTSYRLTTSSGEPKTYRPDQIVHFRGHNSESSIKGLSPLETLRRILAEEHAAGDYRENFWRNAARMGGLLERPAGAPEWSETARERFRSEFKALYSGGENSGETAILEEGMTWRPMTFNAQESEYLAGRRLTREEVARAYHIPPPMVGILDHATFSNITEQTKMLYRDTLGPWLAMVEADIELQLLPEFEDSNAVYVEFNINEKLQGSFEEQVKSLQSAVGRPWMTPDEARARLNLPAIGGDAELLATPLNVLIGGQASPRDSAPLKAKAKGEGEIDPTQPELRKRHIERWSQLLARTFERQRAAVMSKVGDKSAKNLPEINVLWDFERWNDELATDLFALSQMTAFEFGRYVTEQLGDEFSEERMLEWLMESSRIAAENTNLTTMRELEEALLDTSPLDAIKRVFMLAIGVRVASLALRWVTGYANFGAYEGARQGGMTRKTWQVNSKNPRATHSALDGVTVGIRETFANGLRWPGDSRGPVEEVADCQCSVRFGR